MNFKSTAEQYISCSMKPTPAVFSRLRIVTEAARKFQFGQIKLESETSYPMYFTNKVSAANDIKSSCSKLLL